MSGRRWWWCWAWLGCGAVLAEPHEPPPAPAVEVAAPLALSLPPIGAGSGPRASPPGVEPAQSRPSWSRLTLVELPPDTMPGIGPQRRHHALRFGLEAPRTWLRDIGVDAHDCAGQVRAPGKVHAGSRRGDPATYDAEFQFRLQCQY